MRALKYLRPKTVSDVFAMLSEYGPNAMILAGGTDVMVRLRASDRIDAVIDIKRTAGLSSAITRHDDFVRVGAQTVMRDLIENECVRRWFPALVDAARVVGSVQIRNRATLAGNICNASPAADTAAPLLAYGASVNVAGSSGRRRVDIAEFFLGPGSNVLQRGEIMESIDLPIPKCRTGASFGRVTRRRGVDLATINLCCLVNEDGKARFAYGAVAPTPLLMCDDSGLIADPTADAEMKASKITEFITRTNPISNVRGSREYRLAMLSEMSRRALATAMESMANGDARDWC